MNKVKVTIGITAYNEEPNIKNMLLSVLAQNEQLFVIDEIIVISDGSTDKTVERVRELNDSRINLIDSPVRFGKSKHLNSIFEKAKGDYVILFDADVKLAHNDVINELVNCLMSDTRIGLAGGNPQPLVAETFVEKAVNASFVPYDNLRGSVRGGHNPYGCDGRILGLNIMLAKQIKIPDNMIANDAFIYFSCVTNGFKFMHVRNAVVLFRSPQTLKDQLRQNKRFIAARHRLRKHFGNIVDIEYTVPRFALLRFMLLEFLMHPVLSVSIFFINRYCAIRAKIEEPFMTATWSIAVTTKKDIIE